jgi:predicted alpha/beta-fold hydrolase
VSPRPDLPPFQPRFPWLTSDLQTIASRLRSPVTLAPHTSERLKFPLPDGTGDTLLACLDRPATPRAGAPLAILIHGLTGSEDSRYIFSMARLLLHRGNRVLRLNLRGAGPSRGVCGQHYYAGRSQDFRLLLSVLPKELTADGMVAVGYSLGGAMLL